jgi:formylglycine-generating enzyme required for sulfatase activity
VDRFEIANAWGLSDMHGNVYEWCQDHWHEDYKRAPEDRSAWLIRNSEAKRVVRGGCWATPPRNCRSAYRDHSAPGSRYHYLDFRVSCSAPQILRSLAEPT